MSDRQMDLVFASEIPLHRERDRPRRVKYRHWSSLIDRICVRGGVAFTHEAMMRDFHRCCPDFRDLQKVSELAPMHLMRWEWYWERWHADY
ncbi:MAG: hypothetical protein ACYC4U_11270 [Pirellulaceae bacterium]